MALNNQQVEKLTKQEACQSILHKHVKYCMETFGCEPTQEALEWFYGVIGRELDKEKGDNKTLLFRKKEKKECS